MNISIKWVKSWRTTQTIFPWSKTSPHKLPWNWPTMDNCAPYYSKPCCGYVNGSKLPPDERLKPTEWMTVPWVPLKEGQIHFFLIVIAPRPLGHNQARTGKSQGPVTTTTHADWDVWKHMCVNERMCRWRNIWWRGGAAE